MRKEQQPVYLCARFVHVLLESRGYVIVKFCEKESNTFSRACVDRCNYMREMYANSLLQSQLQVEIQ